MLGRPTAARAAVRARSSFVARSNRNGAARSTRRVCVSILTSGGCGSFRAALELGVFSSDGRGMYTYLTNGARRHSRWLRRRHDGIPAQREPHPLAAGGWRLALCALERGLLTRRECRPRRAARRAHAMAEMRKIRCCNSTMVSRRIWCDVRCSDDMRKLNRGFAFVSLVVVGCGGSHTDFSGASDAGSGGAAGTAGGSGGATTAGSGGSAGTPGTGGEAGGDAAPDTVGDSEAGDRKSV